MKVKELIEKLSKCNPDADVGYEHLYLDYVVDEGDYVETGGNHSNQYSEWIDFKKLTPTDVFNNRKLYVLTAIPVNEERGIYEYTVELVSVLEKQHEMYKQNNCFWTTFPLISKQDVIINKLKV